MNCLHGKKLQAVSAQFLQTQNPAGFQALSTSEEVVVSSWHAKLGFPWSSDAQIKLQPLRMLEDLSRKLCSFRARPSPGLVATVQEQLACSASPGSHLKVQMKTKFSDIRPSNVPNLLCWAGTACSCHLPVLVTGLWYPGRMHL